MYVHVYIHQLPGLRKYSVTMITCNGETFILIIIIYFTHITKCNKKRTTNSTTNVFRWTYKQFKNATKILA